MGSAEFEIVAIVVGLLVTGGFLSFGFRTWLDYRLKRANLHAPAGAEVERLTDLVEQVQHEVHGLRQDVGELHERVDFAERLLARSQDADARRLPQ